MRTITIVCTLMFLINCKAQTPILPLYNNENYGDLEGAYYKDTFNDFNLFEGTWQYTNGNNIFKIVLQKKEMVQYISPMGGRSYYKDILIGEYKYIKNGIEKVNTLDFLNNSYSDPYEHYIAGGITIEKYDPNGRVCIGCNPGDVQVSPLFREPNVDIPGAYVVIYLKHYIENGVEKLEAEAILRGNPTYNINDPNPTFDEYSLPLDTTFILTKQ